MVEYRPLPDADLDQYRSYLSYAFNPTGERFDPEETEEIPPPATVGDRRGLYDEETLVSVCVHHYFNTCVREGWHDMAGLSAVATPPEFRRRGHIRTLLEESLAEYRDRNVFLSALWAFSDPFYAKYGWATSNRYAHQTGPPSALSFSREYAAGSFVQPDVESDWERLNEVLLSHGADYQLTVDRTQEWWEKRVFHGWQQEPYVYAWKFDGSIEGYLVYVIEDTESDGSQIQLWDMAYTSHRARMNLLRFLANHDGQIDSIRLSGPADALLVDLLPDPSTFTFEVKAGPMVRLVDVQAAFESIGYPEGVATDVVIEVEDSMAPWNADTFEISIADGTAAVERTDRDPDVTAGVGPLSQLFIGYQPLETLRNGDGVTVHDAVVVPQLSAALPAAPGYLREGF